MNMATISLSKVQKFFELLRRIRPLSTSLDIHCFANGEKNGASFRESFRRRNWRSVFYPSDLVILKQLSPSGSVKSGGYIPRRFASRSAKNYPVYFKFGQLVEINKKYICWQYWILQLYNCIKILSILDKPTWIKMASYSCSSRR